MAEAYWSNDAGWRSGSKNQDERLGTPGILNKVLTTKYQVKLTSFLLREDFDTNISRCTENL